MFYLYNVTLIKYKTITKPHANALSPADKTLRFMLTFLINRPKVNVLAAKTICYNRKCFVTNNRRTNALYWPIFKFLQHKSFVNYQNHSFRRQQNKDMGRTKRCPLMNCKEPKGHLPLDNAESKQPDSTRISIMYCRTYLMQLNLC